MANRITQDSFDVLHGYAHDRDSSAMGSEVDAEPSFSRATRFFVPQDGNEKEMTRDKNGSPRSPAPRERPAESPRYTHRRDIDFPVTERVPAKSPRFAEHTPSSPREKEYAAAREETMSGGYESPSIPKRGLSKETDYHDEYESALKSPRVRQDTDSPQLPQRGASSPRTHYQHELDHSTQARLPPKSPALSSASPSQSHKSPFIPEEPLTSPKQPLDTYKSSHSLKAAHESDPYKAAHSDAVSIHHLKSAYEGDEYYEESVSPDQPYNDHRHVATDNDKAYGSGNVAANGYPQEQAYGAGHVVADGYGTSGGQGQYYEGHVAPSAYAKDQYYDDGYEKEQHYDARHAGPDGYNQNQHYQEPAGYQPGYQPPSQGAYDGQMQNGPYSGQGGHDGQMQNGLYNTQGGHPHNLAYGYEGGPSPYQDQNAYYPSQQSGPYSAEPNYHPNNLNQGGYYEKPISQNHGAPYQENVGYATPNGQGYLPKDQHPDSYLYGPGPKKYKSQNLRGPPRDPTQDMPARPPPAHKMSAHSLKKGKNQATKDPNASFLNDADLDKMKPSGLVYGCVPAAKGPRMTCIGVFVAVLLVFSGLSWFFYPRSLEYSTTQFEPSGEAFFGTYDPSVTPVQFSFSMDATMSGKFKNPNKVDKSMENVKIKIYIVADVEKIYAGVTNGRTPAQRVFKKDNSNGRRMDESSNRQLVASPSYTSVDIPAGDSLPATIDFKMSYAPSAALGAMNDPALNELIQVCLSEDPSRRMTIYVEIASDVSGGLSFGDNTFGSSFTIPCPLKPDVKRQFRAALGLEPNAKGI